MHELDATMALVGRSPVPSHQEQIELGRAIRAWQDHPDGPENAPPLVQRRGRRALDRLVTGNLRLVAKLVSDQARRGQLRDVPPEDLFQMGSLGLLRAAMKFRPELGYTFSTYAVWWVRQALSRARGQGLNITLPGQLLEVVDCAFAHISRRQEAGEVIDLDAVAADCNRSSRRVSGKRLRESLDLVGRTRCVSLNATAFAGERDDLELEGCVADERQGRALDELEHSEQLEAVRVALEALEPEERELVMALEVAGHSYTQLSKDMGVGPRGVKGRGRRAIDRLRDAYERQLQPAGAAACACA